MVKLIIKTFPICWDFVKNNHWLPAHTYTAHTVQIQPLMIEEMLSSLSVCVCALRTMLKIRSECKKNRPKQMNAWMNGKVVCRAKANQKYVFSVYYTHICYVCASVSACGWELCKWNIKDVCARWKSENDFKHVRVLRALCMAFHLVHTFISDMKFVSIYFTLLWNIQAHAHAHTFSKVLMYLLWDLETTYSDYGFFGHMACWWYSIYMRKKNKNKCAQRFYCHKTYAERVQQ